MVKIRILSVSFFLTVIIILYAFSTNENKVAYQRVVSFRFKENTCHKAIEKHMKDFAALKNSITYIKTYSGGLNVPASYENTAKYDCMHYMTFETEKDIERYFNHPAHQKFIRENKHIWEDVFVQNSKIDF